jgi:FkbM family methyltransferase
MIEVHNQIMQRLFHSYSQWGEDRQIERLLGHKRKGFYVDVGAYDPIRFSNTKRFYEQGWNGINIEPDPRRSKKFRQDRPRDITLNVGIANKTGLLSFFTFEPETLSTFSQKSAAKYQKQGFNLVRTTKVPVRTLASVLRKYAKNEIDFLSVDTEGYDFEVLQSNDWKKFSPKIICIEQHDRHVEQLLRQQKYTKAFQNKTNTLFTLDQRKSSKQRE